MATTDGKGRPIWVVAAERSDAGRFIVHADQELPAFLELESAIQTHRHNHECDCPEPDEELGSNRRQSQQSRVGAVSQLLIRRGERSGLLTRIATTESVSLCARMIS
jgi:hypothetical protein